MRKLFKKIDLFYSLAMAGDRASFFQKLAMPTVTAELAQEIESLGMKKVAVGDDLFNLKQQILAVANATANRDGSVYIDTVTVLTKINRAIQLQTAKRN